jgi:hypothetical protein
MSLRTKFAIANVLMAIGMVPLAVCVTWAVGIVTATSGQRPLIPIMDLGMIGLSIVSFILACAVAGTSAAWSWDLARAHPHNRSRIAAAFRSTTAVVLISPFLLIGLAKLL